MSITLPPSPEGEQGASHAWLSSSDDPLISCVSNFLNEEKYLAQAIESVIAQTFSNWELILVDDGSSDASAAIAAGYCDARRTRIRYLAHPNGENRGSSASRNLGLRDARGLLVAFLDADDTWFPEKLDRQLAIFREYPEAVMTCGSTLYWHSWLNTHHKPDELIFTGDVRIGNGWVRSLEQDRLYAKGELLKRLYPLGAGMTPSLSGMMIKRDAALRVGGFEEEFRGLFDDQVLRAKMYLAGPIYVSSLCFDRYRQHAESCTHAMQGSAAARELRWRFLQWLRNYLRELGEADRNLQWKLWKAMFRCEHPRLYRLIARTMARIRPAGM